MQDCEELSTIKQAVIFDDVITTSATVEDLHKCHEVQGVAPVAMLSLARASLKRGQSGIGWAPQCWLERASTTRRELRATQLLECLRIDTLWIHKLLGRSGQVHAWMN